GFIMRIWIVSILLLSLTISVIAPRSTLAQIPEGSGQEPDRIVVGTSEVVLDAVVKDKKGRPVKDLAASDFEVFEDGVPQQVKSFRLVTRDAAPLGVGVGEANTKNKVGATEREAGAA